MDAPAARQHGMSVCVQACCSAFSVYNLPHHSTICQSFKSEWKSTLLKLDGSVCSKLFGLCHGLNKTTQLQDVSRPLHTYDIHYVSSLI